MGSVDDGKATPEECGAPRQGRVQRKKNHRRGVLSSLAMANHDRKQKKKLGELCAPLACNVFFKNRTS